MTKLIIDTNKCRNHSSPTDFFGSRNELLAIADKVKILIPQIVIDEIKHQKRMNIDAAKNTLKRNPLLTTLGIDPSRVDDLDTNSTIEDSLLLEEIPFSIVDISDKLAAFDKIVGWATNYEPPFQKYIVDSKTKNSDKGFKDAYIACIVDEIAKESNEHIILLTSDDMLAKKYQDNPLVKVAREYNDLPAYIIDTFIDDYLKEKLKEDLSLASLRVVESWLNKDDNWVLLIEGDSDRKTVIIDSTAREILESDTPENVNFFFKMLRDSNSFQQTDDGVLEMIHYIDYLKISEIIELIESATTNNQIYWISKKDDIKAFFNPLFIQFRDMLNEDVISNYEKLYDLEN